MFKMMEDCNIYTYDMIFYVIMPPCCFRVVVEVRQRTLWIAGRSWTRRRTTRRTTRRRRGDEERRGEEEQATDIKSNNPHLAGGE